MVADVKQQREHKLGNGAGAVGRDIGDRDALLLGVFHVHHVITVASTPMNLTLGHFSRTSLEMTTLFV
jgi:hypothetical protein